MKKLPLFLLASIILSCAAYTPKVNAQSCTPKVSRLRFPKEKRVSSNLVKVNGAVRNRSSDCPAYNVYAVYKVGREYERFYIGTLEPGEKESFEHLIYAGRSSVRLVKFEHE